MNFTEAQLSFLSAIRNSLWRNCEQVCKNYKTDNILSIAKEQCVIPLIVEEISRSLATENAERLKVYIYNQAALNLTMNRVVSIMFQLLNGQGINATLLKGQGLALYYPMPEIRPCGDVDLYFGPEQYVKACNLLSKYSIDTKQNPESDSKYHVIYEGIEFELHKYTFSFCHPKLDRLYREWEVVAMQDTNAIEIDGTIINVPSVDFNVFFLFVHLWNHFMTAGIGIRQFCDLAMFLKKEHQKINNDSLLKNLVKFDLLIPWQAVGCVLVTYLGLSESYFPFYESDCSKRGDAILNRVFKEGNFGHERAMLKKAPSHYYFRKANTFFHYLFRSISIARYFPRWSFRNLISIPQRVRSAFMNHSI